MDAASIVQKFGPFKEGQVLLFRNVDIDQDLVASELDAYCVRSGMPRPLLVFLYGGQTLAVLDEAEMAKGGWIPKQRLEDHIRQADTASGQRRR